MKKVRIFSMLSLLLTCLLYNAAAQTVTAVVYDVHAHKFVPGVMVSVMPLSTHNGAMGYLPSDPNSSPLNLGLEATTDREGRATFEVGDLLPIVNRVNKELAESPRRLLTKHYEVGIVVFARGYQCSRGSESLHHILEAGVVEDIAAPQCKSDVKPETFHAKPGEIVVFVSHAI
jgi:hypothetical protein